MMINAVSQVESAGRRDRVAVSDRNHPGRNEIRSHPYQSDHHSSHASTPHCPRYCPTTCTTDNYSYSQT